jgi:hypothetical protein
MPTKPTVQDELLAACNGYVDVLTRLLLPLAVDDPVYDEYFTIREKVKRIIQRAESEAPDADH